MEFCIQLLKLNSENGRFREQFFVRALQNDISNIGFFKLFYSVYPSNDFCLVPYFRMTVNSERLRKLSAGFDLKRSSSKSDFT